MPLKPQIWHNEFRGQEKNQSMGLWIMFHIINTPDAKCLHVAFFQQGFE